MIQNVLWISEFLEFLELDETLWKMNFYSNFMKQNILWISKFLEFLELWSNFEMKYKNIE